MFPLLNDVKKHATNFHQLPLILLAFLSHFALNAKGETCLSMMIDENHLSLMSTGNLYASVLKVLKKTKIL